MKLLGRDQPWSILLLAALLIFGAVSGTICAVLLIVFGSIVVAFTSVVAFIPMLFVFIGVAAILIFLVALVYLALAYGLLIHNSVAWWIVFIFADIGLLGAIVSFFTVGFGIGLISLIGAVCIVAILLHKDTIDAIEPLKAIGIDWSGWSLEE